MREEQIAGMLEDVCSMERLRKINNMHPHVLKSYHCSTSPESGDFIMNLEFENRTVSVNMETQKIAFMLIVAPHRWEGASIGASYMNSLIGKELWI